MSNLKDMYKTLQQDPFPREMTLRLGDKELVFRKRTWEIDGETKGLRYGENPDQPAALYEPVSGELDADGVALRGPGKGLVSAISEEHMLQAGKHPGKINLTDVDNGLNILQYLEAKPAAVILKHNNPCGAAWSDDGIATALRRAFDADRIAAFGGAIVLNRPVDMDCAQVINSAYFEVVAAPDFAPDALDELKKRKNLRIIKLPGINDLSMLGAEPFLDVKSLVDGGVIVQFSFRNRIRTVEDFLPAKAEKDGASFIARGPEKAEAEDLLFAWAVESGVTSNSVLFVKDGATVAIGTGEQDRVGCVQLAVSKAYTKYADLLAFDELGKSLFEVQLAAREDDAMADALADIQRRTAEAKGGIQGSVAVSDGFFPFRDGVDLCIEQGVSAIAQPGGSIRDHEIIQAVNEATPQVAMVFTGQRSFKH
ncbi:phosphoribosylaminoimidazolecarboxamide formyltransferase / IMP cyclohydrolase [Paucidesulfovibrio gracilis DSM 16080]|uniref:Phosphoribosylaminoimidazolecarboxamide formyltransferase / IMP cyclohydrolase n=1 Tax=Paucidesulfovibrio gracilis DSM 16080 TaxID=1121449 RepID=A0A1T4XZX6_9BACT|nr:IMP cyclohydrolase [Paucidesulfovibrio gracilis]SKA95076.1 phosphoribosylaminoimidazolecarboxamide formyltransferase / IMP cyclohydrolase [Paucidesulfovibrio gracilis DSM 16080]